MRRPLIEIFDTPPPLPTLRWRHYFAIYEQYFHRFRVMQRPVRMLEIGVQGGGSQWMWRQYFDNPNAVIVGLDIDRSVLGLGEITGTQIVIGDQTDITFLVWLNDVYGPFDIIVDDGGHTAHQQITSMETLYHTMAPDGVYLVEDTHTALWGGRFADDPQGRSFLDFAFECSRRLMDWTGVEANFDTLMSDDHASLGAASSLFCRTTKGVHFYDSIVVFERGPRLVPRQMQQVPRR